MGKTPELKIKKLHEKAIIPAYQTKGAAGFDVHAVDNLIIRSGEQKLVKLGIAFEIPEGYEVQIRPRSGLALKHGIVAHFGTIDSDFRGEVGAILFNHSIVPFVVKTGDRIAQAVLVPVVQGMIVEADELTETERGENGFGSTGVSTNA